jgi:hypothetical protein
MNGLDTIIFLLMRFIIYICPLSKKMGSLLHEQEYKKMIKGKRVIVLGSSRVVDDLGMAMF